MEVSELAGGQLDYWVARAVGKYLPCIENGGCWVKGVTGGLVPFEPSTDWQEGGPIIEHERIEMHRSGDGWYADSWGKGGAEGETMLIAGMRAYVASKFGDEVPDEVSR